ncbi:MAG: hypothetical protein LBI33_05065 [Propionibacteriaceae bacterium]|jgi:hypothetical protein|nr:hypothetical protein [Propionibacteriaceae bacterium]
MSPDTLVAFIDESHYEDPRYGYFYTMTGAIVDFTRTGAHREMMRQLDQLARSFPSHTLHAHRMAARNPSSLEAAQQAIIECDAVRLLVTVRTWRSQKSGAEDARQICLAELATQLQKTGGVERMTLDTRDQLGASSTSSKPQPGGDNANDMATLAAMRKAKELDPSTAVDHADDQRVHQLWIPDIVGYVVARSIAREEPGYMRILAPKVELREALVLPVAQRRPGAATLEPTLGPALARHHAHTHSYPDEK